MPPGSTTRVLGFIAVVVSTVATWTMVIFALLVFVKFLDWVAEVP